MATTLAPPPAVATTHALPHLSMRRGLGEWLTTPDHKKIGIMYMFSTFIFFLVGGLAALLVRLQLALPEAPPFNGELYTHICTVHASVMIFLFIIPFGIGGLGNYLVPLMIGARDMAFPKINALSFWMIPPAAIMMLSGFFTGGAADAGWTSYPPLSVRAPFGQSLWLVAVIILGTSSILGSINFLVTILNMRTPGMTMHRVPLFVWAILTTSFIQLVATPALAAALLMVLADRHLGTHFFDPNGGGAVVGYQQSFFMLMTMLIAIPTGIKIFNWAGTLWGGHLQFKAPLLFSLGFLTMFVIGGLSGVYSAVVPVDYELHDTYFVVAHIHYVLFGGSVFALFAGIYYWFPKVSGRLYHEGLAAWHFWLMIIGFNMTFFPMHILGVQGMQRRIATYPIETGFLPVNVFETVGAFLLGFSMLIFAWNALASWRRGAPAGNDPWLGNTLEWLTTSPPPAYNFASLPRIRSERPLRDLRMVALSGDGVAQHALESGHTSVPAH